MHHHTGEKHDLNHQSTENELTSFYSDSCSICDFEFVQFIAQKAFAMPVEPVSFSKVEAVTVDIPTFSTLTLLRLRAPPVC